MKLELLGLYTNNDKFFFYSETTSFFLHHRPRPQLEGKDEHSNITEQLITIYTVFKDF